SAAHHLAPELPALEVPAINIRNFQLSPGRGLQAFRHPDDLVIVKVNAGDGVSRLGLLRLFFERNRAAMRIEFDYTITLGISHGVGKDGSAGGLRCGIALIVREFVSVENVVAQDQATGVIVDETLTNDERLRQAVRRRLDGVLEFESPIAAVT